MKSLFIFAFLILSTKLFACRPGAINTADYAQKAINGLYDQEKKSVLNMVDLDVIDQGRRGKARSRNCPFGTDTYTTFDVTYNSSSYNKEKKLWEKTCKHYLVSTSSDKGFEILEKSVSVGSCE